MLFDNYDLLMDSPNSIVKMRKLILQLAVQGKLVVQDPTDEPASELLKRIKAEKEKLIAEGKIKKQKTLPPINKDEIPYELPDGWGWVRLGELAVNIHYGFTASANNSVHDVRLLRITDIQNNKVNWNVVPGCEIRDTEIGKYELRDNDILIARTGGTIGKSFIVKKIPVKAVFASYLIKVIPCEILDADYIKLSLESPMYWTQLFEKSMGTGQPNVNASSLKQLKITLPPLAEQELIVAKVDQLMHLCDQLDACQKKAATKFDSLNDAALEKLLSSRTIDEFANHWQFICNNFDLIYNDPAYANKLRQAILQLAVQGKLAPQDPNDEPASELLKRIKAEKEKLITEGKTKKQKLLSPITDDEIPYELPHGWEWVRLDDICSYIQRGKGPKYVDNSEFPVVSQKCIQWHGFQIEKARFIDPASLDKYAKERFLQTGDLLWNSTGTGTIGRLCVYIHDDNPYDKVVADSHVTIVRPIMINSEYLFSFLASPTIQDGFEGRASGTTNQIELATSIVKNQVIPLAPLTEQKRIVAKVDQLMHLCDELETGLNQSKKDGEMLMRAVLHEAFS